MGFPATLDGLAVFGVAVRFKLDDSPRERQVEGYPRLDGLEVTDLGDRGMRSSVSGELTGETVPELAAAVANLRAFKDGRGHLLTDTLGRAWPNVILERVSELQFVYDVANGVYVMYYSCEFLHATSG